MGSHTALAGDDAWRRRNRPLQRERQRRGWPQTKLADELCKVAASEGQRVPVRETLVSMISRWENGHAEPDVFYRHLLREVYSKTDAELGFSDPVIGRDGSGRVWLSIEDLCRELDIPASTAYKWSSLGSESGRFPRCRRLPNGKIRIRRDWLDEWLDGLPTG